MKLVFAVRVASALFVCAVNGVAFGDEQVTNDAPAQVTNTFLAKSEKAEEETPKFLYKVLSAEDWKESQKGKVVKLASADSEFIHLSKFDQLDRLLVKYWADVPEFVVLKLDTAKLPGKLVFETNPGGVHKYYHLYNGSIPLDAVVDSKVFKSSQSVAP